MDTNKNLRECEDGDEVMSSYELSYLESPALQI